MSTHVRVFRSTDAGAPQLSGTAGALQAILYACGETGYGTVTLTSLTVASGVATATVSGGHNFTLLGLAGGDRLGQVIRVAGVTGALAALNTDWRISTIPSSTQFTFSCSGVADGTAAGTITAKIAPFGLTRVYESGGQQAVFRFDDVTSTRLYLDVDDRYTTTARVRGYETMSGVGVGTGPFPTTAQIDAASFLWGKANYSSGVRGWTIIADSKTFFFLPEYSEGEQKAAWYRFGDYESRKAGDAYNCALNAMPTSSPTLGYAGYNADGGCINSFGDLYLYGPRSYTQLGTALQLLRYGDISHGNYSGHVSTADIAPAAVDGGYDFYGPLTLRESQYVPRGYERGAYQCLQRVPGTHRQVLSSLPDLPGRSLMLLNVGNTTQDGRVAFDIVGPW